MVQNSYRIVIFPLKSPKDEKLTATILSFENLKGLAIRHFPMNLKKPFENPMY